MSSIQSFAIPGLIAAASLSMPGQAEAQAVHYAGKVIDDPGKGIAGALIGQCMDRPGFPVAA